MTLNLGALAGVWVTATLAFGQASQPLAAPAKPAQTFPAELVKAGENLFVQDCAFCHGRDTGGGESGPDLTRSKIVTDYVDGKVKWTHEPGSGGSGAGVLTTESGLTFTGDAQGSILALRSSDGETLWHAGMGQGMQSSPVTYELDGRQFVLSSGGGVMFAWALPEK